MTTVLATRDGHAVDETLRSALASGARPARPSALSASLTFGWRALLKIKYVPEQLFDVTAFPVMMTLMFTFLFGGAIAGSTVEYVQFLLPGIVVMSVVFITMYSGIALNTDISKGIFDRVRTLPVWQPSALVGALLGDVARYTVTAVVVLVLGLILGFNPEGGVLGVVSALVLVVAFGFSVSWSWITLALILRTPSSVLLVSQTILFPVTFVSNVFVDPRTMPSWLEVVVNANPMSVVVTATRGLMHGTVTASEIGWVLLWCAAFIALFGVLTMHLYRNKQ